MSGGRSLPLPEGRLGQIACVAITLVAVAVVWTGCIAPLRALYDDGETGMASQAAVLAHMRIIAADLPTLRRIAKTAAAAHAADTSSALIPGETDAIAAANLQNTLQDIAAGVGVLPSSIEVLPAVQHGAFRRIGLQIETTASWPVLVDFLKALDDSTLGLVVDDLSLHALATSGDAGADAVHPMLDTSLMVFGFRLGVAAGEGTLPRSASLAAPPND